MKKVLLALGVVFASTFAQAQNGLEKIIVETYYVADATDNANSNGVLPVGSTTYRVYVDMLPGYTFQQAYGDSLSPSNNRPMTINSTTTFYNDDSRGSYKPSNSLTNVRKSTLMLDSWLSVGGVCVGKMGVLKSEDNDGALSNTDGNLTYASACIGTSITSKDGMVAGSPKTPAFIGFDPSNDIFDNVSQQGGSFSNNNGSWYVFGGATGPNADTNRVLIGQFTTDGDFSFNLNIQLGTPLLGIENYVYKNATGAEILFPSLSFSTINCGTVSVNELDQKENLFSVFPNPADNQISLTLNNAKNASYAIYTVDGRLVLNEKLSNNVNNYKVDISSLSSGQYFIQVTNDGVSSTQKIVKIQ